jgi:hypothetical protein
MQSLSLKNNNFDLSYLTGRKESREDNDQVKQIPAALPESDKVAVPFQTNFHHERRQEHRIKDCAVSNLYKASVL